MTEILIAFLTGVLGPIVIMLVKYYLDLKKARKDPLRETLEIGSLVTAKIDQIRDELDADRVWITQFHNGANFYPTGKSIAKFSVIYESVKSGVPSVQPSLQNIPVNLFSKSLNQLLDEHLIVIPDYNDQAVATYGLKAFSEGNDSKSGYFFAIKTIEDKFIGVLGIEFTNEAVHLPHDALCELEMYASSIGGFLNNHLQR